MTDNELLVLINSNLCDLKEIGYLIMGFMIWKVLERAMSKKNLF